MKNKLAKIILFMFIFIFLSVSVLAHSASLTWTMNKPDYEVELYPCTTSDCSSVGSRMIFDTASGYTYYMYYTTPYSHAYHAAYFYKEGYRPVGYILHSWGDPGYTWVSSFSDDFEKKDFCESDIGLLTVSDDNPTIGDVITVSTNVDSAFTITDDDPAAPKYCPSSHANYFTSDIEVELKVYDSTDALITTLPVQTKSIYQDNSEPVTFNFDTNTLIAGNYKLKLITDPVDSICDQANKVLNDKETWITVDEPIIPNTAPVVSNILGQTITEGDDFKTIPLADYVEDAESPDEDIEWSFSGNTEINIDIDAEHIVTLTYAGGWAGSETITFTAEDPEGLTDSDEATFIVKEIPITNTPPEISLFDIHVFENSGLHDNMIDLWDHAEDAESIDSELTFTITSQTHTDIISCEIDSNRYLDCTTQPDMSGESEITIKVEDPGSLSDEDTFTITVQPVNEAPTVSDIPGQTVTECDSFAVFDLDGYVEDNSPDSEIDWTVTGNTNIIIVIDSEHVVTLTYACGWTGSETLTFTAEDPEGLTDSDEATFTVEEENPNTPPEIDNIPKQILDENSGLNDDLIDLWDYVEDEESDDDELEFTIIEQTNKGLVDCEIDSNRYIDCEVDDDETGSSYVTVEVEDTEGLTDTEKFKIVVREWGDDDDDYDYDDTGSVTIYSVSHEDKVKAGDYLHINVYIAGEDAGIKTTISIEELDIYENFNKLLGIHVQIPETAEAGEYDLKVSVKNREGYRDSVYKDIIVTTGDDIEDDSESDDIPGVTGSTTSVQGQPTFFMQGIKGIATGLFFLLAILVVFLLFLRFKAGR